MKKTKLIVILFVIFFVLIIIFNITDANKTIPEIIGRINDFADMLTSYEEIEIERLLEENEKATSNQIVVVTIDTLGGDVLEDYSIRLAERWKIGQKEKDNGVILLISKQERKLRIEVGYGLEGTLPDGLCGSIIRDKITPSFKEGDYFHGIKNGVNAIIKATKGEYTPLKTIQDVSDSLITFFSLLFILTGSLTFPMFIGFYKTFRHLDASWIKKKKDKSDPMFMGIGFYETFRHFNTSWIKKKKDKSEFNPLLHGIGPMIIVIMYFVIIKIYIMYPIKTFLFVVYALSLFFGGIITLGYVTGLFRQNTGTYSSKGYQSRRKLKDNWSGSSSYRVSGGFGLGGGGFSGGVGGFSGGGGSFGGGGASGGW